MPSQILIENTCFFSDDCLQAYWLGRQPFSLIESLQINLQQQRIRDEIPDTLLFLEHDHIYTLGRRAQKTDILWTEKQCRQFGVEQKKTDRGGQTTYHGPGQLVVYFIFSLKALSVSIPDFVKRIASAAIEYLEQYNLPAVYHSDRPGIWVGSKKIVSLGFHFSRQVSRHGISLNLGTDLNYFSGIIPCGHPTEVTSVLNETGQLLDCKKESEKLLTITAKHHSEWLQRKFKNY